MRCENGFRKDLAKLSPIQAIDVESNVSRVHKGGVASYCSEIKLPLKRGDVLYISNREHPFNMCYWLENAPGTSYHVEVVGCDWVVIREDKNGGPFMIFFNYLSTNELKVMGYKTQQAYINALVEHWKTDLPHKKPYR